MKTSQEMKKELHEYIDSIDDEKTLLMVHEEVCSYLIKEIDDEDEELNEQQMSEISKGLDQIEKGETVDWDTYLKATARWHTK